MKIGFCGSGGIGKSTVLAALAPLIDVPTLPSVARSVFERWKITEADQLGMSPAELWSLQKEIFDARVEAEKEMNGHFISDRTLVDHMAYCLLRANAGMSTKDFEVYEEKMLFSMNGYDLVCYFPFMLATHVYINDGFRQTDAVYQIAIDRMMMGLLKTYGIPFKYVGFGVVLSVEERVQRIKDYIAGVQ